MKKLLILGAGVMQIPIIEKARIQGYEVLVADYNENAPGRKYASKFYCVSTLDKDSILDIARRERIDGILTTSDAPVRVVAYVGRQLGLPVMSEKVSEICTNKYLQREVLKEKGIKCPEYRKFHKGDELCWDQYPCIVKPVDSSASRGVKKISTSEELISAAEDALAYSVTGSIIIESYIEGKEFSVESFTQDGRTQVIAVTEKKTLGEDEGYFVESSHLEPARISEEERKIIEQEISLVATSIGLDNCPSHIELKLNKDGAHIIEVACRLGGDYITSDLVPLSTGVDMLDNLIKVSTGQPIDCKKRLSKFSSVQFIMPNNYSKCEDFIKTGNESIIRYELHPYVNRTVKNSLDRLGYVIIQTNTRDETEKILASLTNE